MDRSADARRFLWPAAVTLCGGIALTVVCYWFVDRSLAEWIRALPATFELFSGRLSVLGKAEYPVVPAVLLFLFFRFVRRRPLFANRALFFVLAVAVAGIVNAVVKFSLARYRPSMFLEHGLYGFHYFSFSSKCQAFPSGHANTVAAAAAALWVIFPRYRVHAIAVAALVGLDRILCLAHYSGDVVFGACLAVATTLLLRGWLENHRFDLLPPTDVATGAGG